MANTIQHKRSTTASSVPSAGQLAVGELALNLTDKKIYSKDGSGNIVEMSPTVVADNSITVAKLSATGTPSSSTFLRGDGSWQSAGGGVTSLNGQTGEITNTTLYAIGSFVIGRSKNSTNYTVNSTIAGSSLYAMSTDVFVYYPNGQTPEWYPGSGPVLVNTGSWRCVSPAYGNGLTYYNGPQGDGRPGLWVRYA